MFSSILDIDDCNPNPCENGGTCLDYLAMYNCTCPAGYLGDKCENSKSTFV